MYRVLLVLLLITAGILTAQNRDMNAQLIKASFKDNYIKQSTKRKLLRFKHTYARYNPLNYAGAGLMYIYQNVLSEQLQTECAYQISCSEFTKLSIQNYGFVEGVLRGFNQLSECHKAAKYEHPQLFVNGNKIINRLDKENK